jgi:hypothetical protein
MANVYDFLGANNNYFLKSSWQVYTNASGSRKYVGKTNNEVTFSPSVEFAEWYDNSSGVQYLYALGVSKFSMMVNFSFMQVLDPNVLPIAWNLDLDTSNANFVYAFAGTSPNNLTETEW